MLIGEDGALTKGIAGCGVGNGGEGRDGGEGDG